MKRTIFAATLLALTFSRGFAADSIVVFNEIHYHPTTNETASEWVELHNQMTIDIDLSAWRIEGGVNYTFAEGTIIPGGGEIVVAANPAVLRASSGSTNVVGPFIGRLNNSGARLDLRDRNDRLMDRLDYRDRGKWPLAPDGSGTTLAKRDGNNISDSPEHWDSSVLVDGTPGRRNFPQVAVPLRRALIPINALWRYETSGADLGTAWRAPGFDDSAWSGRNNATLLSYWPFNGNPNALFGTSGSLVGSVTAADDRNGMAGGALAFNAASQQYVSVAGGGGLNAASAGTIALWVKWTGTQDADCCGTFGAVLARQANGLFSDNVLALNTADPSTARIVWRQTGAGLPGLITGTSIVSTGWHHVAVTFSAAGSTLYFDGAPQGTAVGSSLNNNPAVPLSIGAWAGDGGGFLNGSLDDVAVWDAPLSSAQIAQLAAGTKTPGDFGTPESAVYYAGDGRLGSNDELRRTVLPLGPTTHYFRNTFHFTDDPARTELTLDLAVDDGAVFYLNGTEIYRHNMPPGAVNYATLAASEIGVAPLLNGLSLPASNLVPGTNVLAVEVHQAVANDPGLVFGAGLNATITPAPVVERRPLITLLEDWKFDASNTDLGTAWRASAYNDAAWSNGPAVLFAGNGNVAGLPPERITTLTVAASTEYVADGRLAARCVDGSGLVGNAHVITPGGNMWLNNGTLAAPNDLNPFITFDLGSITSIRSMKVWNYNEFLPGRPELLARGVSRGDILTGHATNALSTLIPGQSFILAPGTQTDFSQTIDLSGVSARFVRLDKLTNFPGGDNRFVGLSEVQFFRDTNVKRTEMPLGAVTYYFRKAFNFVGDPAATTLTLNAAVDDGAIFYLNGVEVHRLNMPTGSVSHFTLASDPVGQSVFTGPINLAAASLLRGVNVLAVEVHQTSADSDIDALFGAELTATVIPPGPDAYATGDVVFNEVSAANAVPFHIELFNRSLQSLDAEGYVIARTGTSPDAEYRLPARMIAAGEFLVLDEATLGFGAAAGDKLFLYRPGKLAVADAVEIHTRPRGRAPDGTGELLTPSILTPGASNAFALHDEVVINEIMYHAPSLQPEPASFSATNTLLMLTNTWRYQGNGVNLGTDWRAPGFDDSAWPAGPAMFYAPISTVNYPVPKNTFLPLTNSAGTRVITYYFRTQFLFGGDTNGLMLGLRSLIDDGAVFYLNGVEVLRMNMPATNIAYGTLATLNLGIPGLTGPLSIPTASLQSGLNTLAVEVHQAATTSSDVNFATELLAWNELTPALPFRKSPEQWVELFNRSSNDVNLTGWRLDEGIDFRFASNTMIPPGGYLVVAKDPAALRSGFPSAVIAGPFTNKLSAGGERVVLRDAADNPANAVHYYDDGRWPKAADAGGASLELRDPWADGNAGEAWAASNESGRSAWRTYSYRGLAAASAVGPDTQWHEFVIGLLDRGVVLLDDISVIETPATTPVQMIQNGTFDTGTDKWRLIGNHHGEVIDDPEQPGNKVLRLVANGSTEHMSNHGETTFVGNRDVVNGREYLISFRAKWISGSRQFHTRLYFNRLPRTTLLDIPALHGTPGSQNTAFTTNIGPTYAALRHDPPVPTPFAPVTISVQTRDPDGVASLSLWWRPDGGAWLNAPMVVDGAFNDPSVQRFTGNILGQPAGTVVQFFIEAADGLGAKSTFPTGGTNSRALCKVDDGLAATNGLHNFRLVTLAAEADELHRTVNLMSNERIDGTMIYDEREIFYGVGLRLKGSEHSRTTTPRLGFNVAFNSDQLFRGVHGSVAIDRSESTGYGQREMLVHQMLNHCGGVPTKYHDLIQVMAPRLEHTGAAELQLARYSDVFLDDQFKDGTDGTVYEYELVYQLNPPTDNGTPEGNKVPAPDSVVGTAIRNLGDDKENYRWDFLIKNNEDKDDFSKFIPFCKWMEMTGTNFTVPLTNIIDVDQWLRGVAVNVLSGCGDSYGGDGAQHNVQFYVRPTDGRVLYFPHDMDAFFNANRSIVPNADLTKIIAVPAYARAYYCHLLDIIATTYNGNYMTRWANHFGRLLPAQPFASHLAFIVQRAGVVTSAVNSAVPNVAFAITTSGGNNFGTSNNVVTISGNAPLGAKDIEINGVRYPITWITTTTWSLQIPLSAGTNLLAVQGLDRTGLRPTNYVDTITITNTGTGALQPVVINEWMALNVGPDGLADPADSAFQDWFELFNPNTNAVNLAGFFLTDDLSQPTRWQIPPGAIIPERGFLLVWADNQPLQFGVTNNDLHAGFQLNSGGEAIGLFSPAGVAQHVVVFGPQIQNVSQGLFPDGVTNAIYSMTNWTPRAANTLAGPLRLTAIVLNNGLVTLTWDAIPGRNYRLQYKNAWSDPSWLQVGGDHTALGPTVTAVDALPAPTHRFYRVTASPFGE